MSDRKLTRSRGICELILRCLGVHADAGLDVGWTAEQLMRGIVSAIDLEDEEVRAEIKGLLERGLIARRIEGKEHRYTITADGRDFVKVDCPWEQVARFGRPR